MIKMSGLRQMGRAPYVDALRGLSILFVLCLHFQLFVTLHYSFISPQALHLVARNGYYGVTIFFVISGFLITYRTIGHYETLAAVRPSEFYQARFARIAPLLATMVFILSLLHFSNIKPFVATAPLSIWAAIWSALTFQYNWYYLAGANLGLAPWGPLWSLSIEELFYIIFPVMGVALRRPFLIVMALFGIVAQGIFARSNPDSLYLWSGCADAIAIGCLTALALRRNGALPLWLGAALRGLGLAIIAFRYSAYALSNDYVAGPTVVAIGAGIFLIGATTSNNWDALVSWPLRILGRRSYEIYLTHAPLFACANIFIHDTNCGELLFLVTLVLMALLGELIGRFFTDPLQRRISKVSSDINRRRHAPGCSSS